MRLASTMKAKVIAKGTTKGSDGKEYYRVTVLQGMESGILGLPLDAYNLVKVDEETVFNTEYNSEYKSFRITGIAADNYNTKTPATTPGGASK